MTQDEPGPRIRPPDFDDMPEPQRDRLRWLLLALALASVWAAFWLARLHSDERPPPPSKELTSQERGLLPQMVSIPAGQLALADGSRVEIEAFSVSRTEVTVAQFRLFVRRNHYQNASWTSFPCRGAGIGLSWDNPGYLQADTFPVVCVSAVDAQAFVRWLSEQTGQRYRLPSEVQWEYAARAGTGSRYWWGDDYDEDKADCNGCGPSPNDRPRFVSSWPANPFGLLDVAGNVGEWTCSVFAAAMTSESTHCAQRLDEGTNLIVRGGSWQEPVEALALSSRRPLGAFQRNVWTGFRVAVD